MTEKAKITFYKIKECGYYKRGEELPEFGSILALLTDLMSWGGGKPLIETKVFEPLDGQDIHPAYLLDIKRRNEAWLIATWNQTPANEAGVASINGESRVGGAEVVINELGPGSIPGFATYFWFLPARGVFASVRFQHVWTGQKSLQCYLESFLEGFSSFVAYSDELDTDVPILGYRATQEDEPQHLSPRFRTALEQKPGRKDYIRQNAHRVRKVTRQTTLKLNRVPDYSLWQTFMHKTHIAAPQVNPENVRVQYDIITPVTLNDVNAMIADWDAHHDREWDDYGFDFTGESNKTHWLSRSLARAEFELEVTRDNAEVINSESLLVALDAAKEQILSILDA